MNKGILYTSYFAKINKGKGIKLSVARYNPKWLKKGDIEGTLINLAPSKELLNKYKYENLSWDKYTEYYLDQINTYDRNVQADLHTLTTLLNQGHDVTVYCYEKSNDNCHRHILGEKFRSMGFDVEEI